MRVCAGSAGGSSRTCPCVPLHARGRCVLALIVHCACPYAQHKDRHSMSRCAVYHVEQKLGIYMRLSTPWSPEQLGPSGRASGCAEGSDQRADY